MTLGMMLVFIGVVLMFQFTSSLETIRTNFKPTTKLISAMIGLSTTIILLIFAGIILIVIGK